MWRELNPNMRIGQWLSLFATLARDFNVQSIYDIGDNELIPVMRGFLVKRREITSTLASI
jgi:hypothetical protein